MADESTTKFPGRPIKHLVLETDDFIVFVDKDIDVDWETTDAYDAKGHADITQFNAILNKAALLESTPCDHFPEKSRVQFKRLVGEAIARALEHDYGHAEEALGSARSYIRKRNTETSRLWYLTGSLVATCVFSSAGLALWLFRESASVIIGRTALYAVLAASAGSLGAMLSITMRIGKSQVDYAAGRQLHYV